jgi:hypothetical protein
MGGDGMGAEDSDGGSTSDLLNPKFKDDKSSTDLMNPEFREGGNRED